MALLASKMRQPKLLKIDHTTIWWFPFKSIEIDIKLVQTFQVALVSEASMLSAFKTPLAASIIAIAGSVVLPTMPAFAGSCNVSGSGACVYTQGLFTGSVSQNSTGSLSYIFPAALGATFTTSPIAFEWGFSVPDNPTPQDVTSIAAFINAWTGVTVGSLVDANAADNPGTTSTFSGSGFSTITLADAYAFHWGGGEAVLLFQTPVALTLSNWSLGNLSNFRSYNITSSWPPPGPAPGPAPTPLPGALWLFGTVLAGGAGFGHWRKKRNTQSLVAA